MFNMRIQKLFIMLIFSLSTIYAHASDFTSQITYYHSVQCNTVSASFCLTNDNYPEIGYQHEEYHCIEKDLDTNRYTEWTHGLLNGQPILVDGSSKEIAKKLRIALDTYISEKITPFQPIEIDKLAHNLAYSHDTGK